jgi:hypothetical protein
VPIVEVADGWYAGVLGMRRSMRFVYGGQDLAINAQLEIFSKGAAQTLVLLLLLLLLSDDTWLSTASSLQSNEI